MTHRNGPLRLALLRGRQPLSLDVMAVEESQKSDGLASYINPERSQIPKLGIVGVGIDRENEAMFPNLRGKYGVFVAAHSEASGRAAVGLQVGDAIHEINGVMVAGVDAVRRALDQIKRGDPVALFIERDGKLLYVAFEME